MDPTKARKTRVTQNKILPKSTWEGPKVLKRPGTNRIQRQLDERFSSQLATAKGKLNPQSTHMTQLL